MEPFWFPVLSFRMPTSLTLKNIPDAVYERLKAAAGDVAKATGVSKRELYEAVLRGREKNESFLKVLTRQRGRWLPCGIKPGELDFMRS